eukprot:CAMPEP_0206264732 /NCGR_PEP_ID=MMETSP0047_2-20121206/29577_1 /ASSEMBLY_ACC=CAM_ASM_000192 /TAXON_ID=195065 /ORGANISM="Chroomonas mesostigmatica_cf, Strain CCMP1168" /LENGTH=69 /DNA_ID=CAMNT_0053692497 /DNA_START=197 /DNA_END=406 /DNA_ORIENTATION=-
MVSKTTPRPTSSLTTPARSWCPCEAPPATAGPRTPSPSARGASGAWGGLRRLSWARVPPAPRAAPCPWS